MKVALKLISLFFLLAGSVCFCSCTSEEKVDILPELQIVDHTLIMHNFPTDILKSVAAVDGKAKNSSSIRIGTATITVTFYDKDGNRLQTSSAIKQNLEPGEVWIYSVQFIGPDAWKTVRYGISANAK